MVTLNGAVFLNIGEPTRGSLLMWSVTDRYLLKSQPPPRPRDPRSPLVKDASPLTPFCGYWEFGIFVV